MSQCIALTEDMLVPKFKPNEPYYAARWMIGRLLRSPRLLDKVEFEVYIRKMKHQEAMCWSYQKHPMYFTLVIGSQLGRAASLRALAHESYHVMQYVTGKMKDRWDKEHLGKVMWGNRMMENTDSAYWNSPWEREARAGQDWLAEAYSEHCRTFDN